MAPIAAVTFDLDDTLYPQADYLAGAWAAVAAAAGCAGVPTAHRRRLHDALLRVAADGSDRGGIIDRALAEAGLPAALASGLVAAFRGHRPDRLATYPGARAAIDRLRRRVPVGCLTDGDPGIQRAKLRALGLDDAFDAVVITDELGGRGHRKPHPAGFHRLLDLLAVPAAGVVHVGDRPGKDVAGAVAAGMRAVRVRTGEYSGLADPAAGPAPWFTSPGVVDAVVRLEAVLAAQDSLVRTSST